MPKRYTSGLSDLAYSDPAGRFDALSLRKYDRLQLSDWGGMDLTSMTAAASGYYGAWFYSGQGANAALSVEQDAGVNGSNISLTAGANDNEGLLLQTPEYFAMTSGKKFFIEVRYEVTAADMAQYEMMLGLYTLCAVNGINNIIAAAGSSITADDGCGWYSLDGSANVIFTSREADVANISTVITTPVTATWYKLSSYYNGTSWYCYVDDSLVDVCAGTNIPVTPVVPTFFYRAGEGAAQTLKVDYLTVISEK